MEHLNSMLIEGFFIHEQPGMMKGQPARCIDIECVRDGGNLFIMVITANPSAMQLPLRTGELIRVVGELREMSSGGFAVSADHVEIRLGMRRKQAAGVMGIPKFTT